MHHRTQLARIGNTVTRAARRQLLASSKDPRIIVSFNLLYGCHGACLRVGQVCVLLGCGAAVTGNYQEEQQRGA
jgi:hypothetical protein